MSEYTMNEDTQIRNSAGIGAGIISRTVRTVYTSENYTSGSRGYSGTSGYSGTTGYGYVDNCIIYRETSPSEVELLLPKILESIWESLKAGVPRDEITEDLDKLREIVSDGDFKKILTKFEGTPEEPEMDKELQEIISKLE
jgi:hypothetical protein